MISGRGHYAYLTGSKKLIYGKGDTKSYLRLNKDGQVTNSCFDLFGAHQCGILMVDV